jgi:hypothetical protein
MSKEKKCYMNVRVSDDDKQFVKSHGNDNITDGINNIIVRYREFIKVFSPRKMFTKMELQAIAGANKGLIWQYNINDLPFIMSSNIEDYYHYESIESSQWAGVDFEKLANNVKSLHISECVSLMDSIELMFYSGKSMFEIVLSC